VNEKGAGPARREPEKGARTSRPSPSGQPCRWKAPRVRRIAVLFAKERVKRPCRRRFRESGTTLGELMALCGKRRFPALQCKSPRRGNARAPGAGFSHLRRRRVCDKRCPGFFRVGIKLPRERSRREAQAAVSLSSSWHEGPRLVVLRKECGYPRSKEPSGGAAVGRCGYSWVKPRAAVDTRGRLRARRAGSD